MLESKGKIIFDGVVEKVSNKTGRPFKIARFIDTENYQRLEFFTNDDTVISASASSFCKFSLNVSRNGFKTFFVVSKVLPA